MESLCNSQSTDISQAPGEARKAVLHVFYSPKEDSVIVEVNSNHYARTGTPGTPSADDYQADFRSQGCMQPSGG